MLDAGKVDTQEVSVVCVDRYAKRDIRSRQSVEKVTVNMNTWKGSIQEIKFK